MLKFLNVGTSVAFGDQDQAPVPRTFRIGGGSPDTNIPGPATVPFLILNPDVTERGERLLGSVHSAYFYKGLSLIGEWQYGFGNYAHPRPPVVGAGAILGLLRRRRLLPDRRAHRAADQGQARCGRSSRRDKGDHRGLGAFEAVARVSELRLGEQIFNSGFADRDLWSNQAITTELGVNWYWNEYIKVYAFWLHGEFADPVQYRPGRLQDTADMFWLRFQLYF